MVNQLYIYVYTGQFTGNPNSNTRERVQPQHDCTAACVIAQQYSSTTFISQYFHSGKKKFSMHFEKFVFLSVFKNCTN
jgi:hypothetical protein